MEQERYFGPNKIALVEECDFKTPKGEDVVRVRYAAENVAPEIMPKKVFEFMVSETPIDYTLLREKRYQPLINELTAVILESDVKFPDLAYVGKTLVTKIEDAFERASSFLWTGNDKAWIPGVDHRSDLTVLEAEQVLKKINNGGGK